MNTPDTAITDDPIAEIHEIRRRLAAQHGNDPHRMGDFLRERSRQRGEKPVRVEKKPVAAKAV